MPIFARKASSWLTAHPGRRCLVDVGESYSEHCRKRAQSPIFSDGLPLRPSRMRIRACRNDESDSPIQLGMWRSGPRHHLSGTPLERRRCPPYPEATRNAMRIVNASPGSKVVFETMQGFR